MEDFYYVQLAFYLRTLYLTGGRYEIKKIFINFAYIDDDAINNSCKDRKWFAGINSINYKLKYANDIDLVNKIVNIYEPKDKRPKKNNNHKKIKNPRTGDQSQPLVLTSAIILAVILITLLLIINKRRNK